MTWVSLPSDVKVDLKKGKFTYHDRLEVTDEEVEKNWMKAIAKRYGSTLWSIRGKFREGWRK